MMPRKPLAEPTTLDGRRFWADAPELIREALDLFSRPEVTGLLLSKVDATDGRLSDARAPLPHTHDGLVPLGAVLAWLKNLAGTPPLSANYIECNGQTLSDNASVYNGATIPNLNGASSGARRFLRGSSTSGATGGADTFTPAGTISTPSATVSVTSGGTPAAGGSHTHVFTGAPAGSLPSYYEVVWVMRIK